MRGSDWDAFVRAVGPLRQHGASMSCDCPCGDHPMEVRRYEDGSFDALCMADTPCSLRQIRSGLSRKLKEVTKNGSRPAEKLETSSVSSVSLVFRKHCEAPDELEPEALHGVAGDAVRIIEPHTESHPAAILASFLVSAGAWLGRRPHVFRDGARHSGNEFACLIGLSAVGRKGTATRRTDEIFNALCDSDYTSQYDTHTVCVSTSPSWPELMLTGLGSGEGLVSALSEAIAAGEECPSRIVFEEEFSKSLKVMAREGSTLSEVLRSGWDGAPLAVRTRGRTHVVPRSHVSLLTHVTDQELKDRLGRVEMFNGFANRFLWFCTRRTKLLPFGGGRVPHAPIIAAMHELRSVVDRGVWEMEFDERARRMWGDGGIYQALTERPPGLLGAVTSRAEAHVTRLSLLYAALDGSQAIRAEHLLAALAVWDYSERSCRYIFGTSSGDEYADKIIDLLWSVYPGGLTRTEIHQHWHGNAEPGRVPKALVLLESEGTVERTKMESQRGRPSELWVLAMHTEDARNERNGRSPLERARELVKARK